MPEPVHSSLIKILVTSLTAYGAEVIWFCVNCFFKNQKKKKKKKELPSHNWASKTCLKKSLKNFLSLT